MNKQKVRDIVEKIGSETARMTAPLKEQAAKEAAKEAGVWDFIPRYFMDAGRLQAIVTEATTEGSELYNALHSDEADDTSFMDDYAAWYDNFTEEFPDAFEDGNPHYNAVEYHEKHIANLVEVTVHDFDTELGPITETVQMTREELAKMDSEEETPEPTEEDESWMTDFAKSAEDLTKEEVLSYLRLGGPQKRDIACHAIISRKELQGSWISALKSVMMVHDRIINPPVEDDDNFSLAPLPFEKQQKPRPDGLLLEALAYICSTPEYIIEQYQGPVHVRGDFHMPTRTFTTLLRRGLITEQVCDTMIGIVNTPLTEVMTAAEVVEEFGLSQSAVRQAINRGQIPARKSAGTWLILRSDAQKQWKK